MFVLFLFIPKEEDSEENPDFHPFRQLAATDQGPEDT